MSYKLRVWCKKPHFLNSLHYLFIVLYTVLFHDQKLFPCGIIVVEVWNSSYVVLIVIMCIYIECGLFRQFFVMYYTTVHRVGEKVCNTTYLLTYLLTYSIEQSSSWEANHFPARQEIPCILWNPKVHYCSHKFLCPVPFFIQLNPVHTPTSHFLKIHFNIISRLQLCLPSSPLPSDLPIKTLYTPHLFSIRATWPTHLTLLDFITRTILGEQYISLSSTLCSFLHFPVTSSILGPNTFLNTLISNTPGYIPPTVRVTMFHTHTKQQAKL
jgi:hypothetical protein